MPTFDEFKVRDKPPFPRLVTFCGRADILQRLCDIFHPAQCEKGGSRPRVISVLLGMGGMGKSQVALEYSYEKQSITAPFTGLTPRTTQLSPQVGGEFSRNSSRIIRPVIPERQIFHGLLLISKYLDRSTGKGD